MYPHLESTLLGLLQLPLSWLNVDQPSNVGYRGCCDLNNLGVLAPYHVSPPVPGISQDLPDDCTIDQAILLHRHGSRGPTGEQSYIFKLVDTLDKARDIIQDADVPPYLEFLKEGYKYDLVPEELTIVGRKELLDHGVEFALRYPTLTTDEVVSTNVQRVVDSAHFFSQGFFGRKVDDVKFRTTEDFKDPISWIIPWESCPKPTPKPAFKAAQKWAEKYVPPITERLNKLIPGVGFSVDDIRGALYACPYDLATRNKSPWCDVFTADELRDLEYELDIFYDTVTGHWHGSTADAGPLVGAFYIKKLIERLTNATHDAKPLYLEFTHDLSILVTLATLNLNKDAELLSPLVDHPPATRKFRTSHQTPFATQMVWERFTCENTFKGPQVRLVLNEATVPLSICEKSDQDKKYGTCSLDEFVRANEYSLSVEYQSKMWNDACEHGH